MYYVLRVKELLVYAKDKKCCNVQDKERYVSEGRLTSMRLFKFSSSHSSAAVLHKLKILQIFQ